jgi:phosphopantothenoylcysteine decarboxylase/phosphopantothenate--cysteine ligase
LTPEAESFVAAKTFEALARREVPRDLFPHLADADLFVIAPLTANTLAKLAHGLADNVLTQAVLAFRGPVLAAPAMNVRMWEHAATQSNVVVLRERGVELIGPDEGELAEGETGMGRMTEPHEILYRCRVILGREGPLAGKKVLVTAGGTQEPLDAVRYLGNRSSGRMGVALAEEARRRGADVTLLAANLAVAAPAGVDVLETPTAAELADGAITHGDADVVLMAAAVADYRPAEERADKRSKDGDGWTVELEPTLDVLAELGRQRSNGQVLVGFAADVGDRGLERARTKLAAKAVDLIVFNDVGRADIGFDAAENEVVIVSAAGDQRVEKAPKSRIAAAILDEVEQLLR